MALCEPPYRKERKKAPITLIKQWKEGGKKREDSLYNEHKFSRKKTLMPMRCSPKSLNTTTQLVPRAVYILGTKTVGSLPPHTYTFFPSRLSPLPLNVV